MTFLVQKKGCLSKKAELKLQIAEESREPVYDLSDCQLTELPKCVESQVKYFNKTVLILHSNLLNRICYAGKVARLSHLTHLDLHSNKFQLFPDEIFSMPLLKVLDLSFNEIRVVPDRIDQLTRIKHLSIEGNRIQSLPSSIGNLHTLEELRFDKNPVTHLPVTLGHLKQLKDISLPLSSIIFPPKDICDLGIPAILSFLRKAGRVTDEESAFAEVGELSSGMGRCQVYGEGGGWHQVAEDLNIHEEIVCRASESRVSSLNKLGRKEEEMKGKLEQFGKQRERGKLELGTTLRGRTKCVDGLICCLHQKQCVLRKDNQPQSSIKHPYSMNTMLDASKADQMRHCVPREDCLTRAEGQEEVESALRCVLASRQADKAQLAAQVANEESKQMKAFECLQRQRDLRRQQIVDDILLAETELSRLTRVERERKASQSALVAAHFSEHRRNLVRLLSELQHQKERRDLELHEFLKGLEEQRERDQTAYWLVQCQRLIDKKPWSLKKESLMDDDICAPLSALGASEHVSNFENLPSTMSTSPTAENPSLGSLPVPSAPSEKENGGESTTGSTGSSGITSPSAPPAIIARFENECCICQDAQCSIIFLPCGHVCCCKFCSAEVTLCPLCRNTVEQHIQLS